MGRRVCVNIIYLKGSTGWTFAKYVGVCVRQGVTQSVNVLSIGE